MGDISKLDAAIVIATLAHSGQVDKAGNPYILHLLRVMENVPDNLKPVALLHDVLEDTDISLYELNFLDPEEMEILLLLTRKEDEQYFDYIKRLSTNNNAVTIKIADLEDNMDQRRLYGMDGGLQSKMLKKYEKAYSMLVYEVDNSTIIQSKKSELYPTSNHKYVIKLEDKNL